MTSLKSSVLREIGALARCVQAISDVKYRELKLHRGQFIFLTRVCEHPGINLIDLSNMLKVDKTTTTKAVGKLAAEGYLTRRRGNDQRMWHLHPTTKATAIYPYIIAEENRSLDICLSGFSQAERETAGRLLARMRSSLEQDWLRLKATRREDDDGPPDEPAITIYTDDYKEAVIEHILSIQRDEYGIAIRRQDQPDLEDIAGFYQHGAGNFWLALDGQRVVGTIGLIDIGGGQGALRKMFVQANYRGGGRGVASRLLAALLAWAKAKNLTAVYLGTTDKFLAAHRFYAKNGFAEIDRADLPPTFPVMKVDSRFFCYNL
jgi:DNA-binding MarR family transcriptional regulator/N-acetylglutamate synthase-like GNAT family acetyltransferase